MAGTDPKKYPENSVIYRDNGGYDGTRGYVLDPL
jgi:hypothetical protein